MAKDENGKPIPIVTPPGMKNPPPMGSSILMKGGEGLPSWRERFFPNREQERRQP